MADLSPDEELLIHLLRRARRIDERLRLAKLGQQRVEHRRALSEQLGQVNDYVHRYTSSIIKGEPLTAEVVE